MCSALSRQLEMCTATSKHLDMRPDPLQQLDIPSALSWHVDIWALISQRSCIFSGF
jgi:hypothetical protein